MHAATRAGGLDVEGREVLLRYVLRPPIAQERVEQQPDGLVRITLKKAYAEREACPRGMERSRSIWIRFRCCAGWPPACPRRGSTRSTTRGYSPQRVHGARASPRPCRRPRRMCAKPALGARAREAGAQERLSALGRNFWSVPSRWMCPEGRLRAPRLPQLPGADEAARCGEEPCQHCPLPGWRGRADRCADPRAWSRPALLEEPGLSTTGAR